MSVTAGSDEVGAVVIDVGSSWTKMGYAGEDTPKAVFPSDVGVVFSNPSKEKHVGSGSTGMEVDTDTTTTTTTTSSSTSASSSKMRRHFVGSQGLEYRRDGMEIQAPLEDGMIKNWDAIEHLWDHGLKTCLRADPKETPLLLSECPWNTKDLREQMTETIFEKYGSPALFVAKDAVLSAFAAGKATALVLDAGGGMTRAVPVYDGYVIKKAIQKSPVCGQRLTEEFLKSFGNAEIKPSYLISKKEASRGGFQVTVNDYPLTTASYKHRMICNVVDDVKHTLGRVSDAAFRQERYTNMPTMSYELPDGSTLDVGTSRFNVPEMLFTPSLMQTASGADVKGVHELVSSAISSVDPDMRRDMYVSVVVCGGTSLFPHFAERLQSELINVSTPQRMKFIAASSSSERRFNSWIGGSILGSLGSFHQMWMSKAEYEEHGRSLIERKCP
eukprot:TRINITY_DN140_c2_g1_i1.p1 TRINITY_DN140_c2_g1~~TRINITY_DN140_c2_g1_i1.p1  ORF type:complete len:443 (+),score=108.09 TRINITY_DN140_c2_g1_i1:232-1560(+)